MDKNKELKTFDKYAIFKTDIIELDNVLMRRLGKDEVEVGQPTIENAKIRCSIIKQTKGPKVIAFRFKRRKKVRVKRGHRQPHTIVRVEAI